MNRAETRALLERRGLHLRRELGQNFLIDESWAERLVELAGVSSEDRVVEIGTGLGALTRALAKRARSVVTIEIDSGVVRALREEALLPGGVELLHADALGLDLAALAAPHGETRLVANLPYSAATPLLRRMLDLRGVFADWSVMVQREVGLRITAQAGTRDYGSLAVLHALCARVESRADVPAECFFPTPKVISSFLHIEPLGGDPTSPPVDDASAPIDDAELRRVERVVRALFGQRRKTLWNGLRSGGFASGAGGREERAREALAEVGIEARTRAEQIEPAAHRALVAALHARELV